MEFLKTKRFFGNISNTCLKANKAKNSPTLAVFVVFVIQYIAINCCFYTNNFKYLTQSHASLQSDILSDEHLLRSSTNDG